MLNQSRIIRVVTLGLLLIVPGIADAGPFGFFKRCRAPASNACAPQSCTPVVTECAPSMPAPFPSDVVQTSPMMESAAEGAMPSATASTQYWYAVGSGRSTTGQTCSFRGGCADSPSGAITLAKANMGTCSPYSYSVFLCPPSLAPAAAESPQAAAPAGADSVESTARAPAPEAWRGYVVGINPGGNPVTRRTSGTYAAPEDAIAAAEAFSLPSGWTPLTYFTVQE
jgi:hypothetical protein